MSGFIEALNSLSVVLSSVVDNPSSESFSNEGCMTEPSVVACGDREPESSVLLTDGLIHFLQSLRLLTVSVSPCIK
ncbi:hypothetical protein Hanom_Chr14g01250741 [Helianthus anomalus]